MAPLCRDGFLTTNEVTRSCGDRVKILRHDSHMLYHEAVVIWEARLAQVISERYGYDGVSQ